MEASKKLGLDFRLVSAVCRGKRQHTGGFNFKYYESIDYTKKKNLC